jgi:hypothetical protein
MRDIARNVGVSKSAIGRRIRHQIHVYKVLKWLNEKKRNRNKSIIIRVTDEYDDSDAALKIFKLNLLTGHEGELIDELDKLFNHISGWNSEIAKIRRYPNYKSKTLRYDIGGRHFEQPFEPYELSLFWYRGEGISLWKGKRYHVWAQRRREMMLLLWQQITGNSKISNDQLAFITKYSFRLQKQIVDPITGMLRSSVKNSHFDKLPLDKLIRIADLIKIEKKLPEIKRIQKKLSRLNDYLKPESPKGVLTRGEVFDLYVQFLEEGVEFEIFADTSLFKALLDNRNINSGFFENDNELNILIDGELKHLTKIFKENMRNAISLDADNEIIKSYLLKRINQLLNSDLKNKKGIPILQMKAGPGKQVMWGIDFEEMLAELAEVVIIAGIDEIIKLFPEIGDERNLYFQVYKGIKDEYWKIDANTSLSPGFGINSRTTASGNRSPVDHIIKVNSESGSSVHIFVNDKKWRWQYKRGRYKHIPPDGKEAKTDILNQIYWSEGEGGKIKYWDEKKKSWESYKKGLESIDKGEAENFKTMMKELNEGSNTSRILVSRQIALAKDEYNNFAFKIGLQIGIDNETTLRHAIEVMKRAGGKIKEEADEIIRIIAYISKKGLVHHDLLLKRVFFIMDPTGQILGSNAEEKVILGNFKDGLRKKGIIIPNEIHNRFGDNRNLLIMIGMGHLANQ